MNSRELLSVGEVADRSGFAASALRYYEAEGLIHASRSRWFSHLTLPTPPTYHLLFKLELPVSVPE